MFTRSYAKNSGKIYVKKQYKANIESDMVLTPEELIKTIPTEMAISGITKNPSARKLLHPFSGLFDAKQKTTVL